MNHDYPNRIDADTPAEKNHFPILLQLGILGVVMLGLFSMAILPNPTPETIPEPEQTPLAETTIEYPMVPQKIESVALQAKAAYVWDVSLQRVLYAKNEGEALPLASITKLMTALLSHELIADDVETIVPLSAIRQAGNSGLTAGEHLGVRELRDLALITSSNDAAHALAATVGELLGTQDAASQFVRGMNIRADELGLPSLEFWNATGLDQSETKPGAIGSARDVTFLMEYIVTQYPELIAPTQQSATRIYNTAGAYHEADNTNEVAREIPNMIGSKTGFTDLAGGNLTIAFDAGHNRPIIITVLGSTRDARFTDVLTLVEAVQTTLGETN